MNRIARWLAGRPSGVFWILFSGAVAGVVLVALALFSASSGLDARSIRWLDMLGLGIVLSLLCLPWPLACLVMLRPHPPATRPVRPRVLVVVASVCVAGILSLSSLPAIAEVIGELGKIGVLVFTILFVTTACLLPTLIYRWRPGETGYGYVARFARGATFLILAAATLMLFSSLLSQDRARFDLGGFVVIFGTAAGLSTVIALFVQAMDVREYSRSQNRCARCGYDLSGLTDCPECGRREARFKPATAYLIESSPSASKSPQASGSNATRSSSSA